MIKAKRKKGPFKFECGDCKVCCTVLHTKDPIEHPPYEACRHLQEGCRGCSIYKARPQECRDFECGWVRGGLGPRPELRPDRCGVMFRADRSRLGVTIYAHEVTDGAWDEMPLKDEVVQHVAQAGEVDAILIAGPTKRAFIALSPQARARAMEALNPQE